MAGTMTLRRLKDGKHGVFEFNQQVGTIDHDHLMNYAKACEHDSAAMSSLIRPFTGGPAVDREVQSRAVRLMREEGLRYPAALKKVLASDKRLSDTYRTAHKGQIGETA